MNKLLDLIGRNLTLIGILLLTVLVGAAAGLYLEVPGRIQNGARAKEFKATPYQYSCPMHPDVVSGQAGNCPKCGMALALDSEPQAAHAACGAASQTERHGCCTKPQPAEPSLPPGHPPIPGHNAHAGRAINPETTRPTANPEK